MIASAAATGSSMPGGMRSLARPAIGTLVFVVFIGPGPLVALVPWIVTGWRIQAPLFDGDVSRLLGVVLFLAGLPVWAEATLRFVRHGHGTPAPTAPPERLVVTGLYRYVRNPMYVGVVTMIVGEALCLGSRGVLIYGVCLALGFHLFVVLYEEPTLRARFGDQYLDYCRRVHRWLPSRPA